MANFNTLYKRTKTGAINSWEILTENSTIITKWGQLGGAIQEAREVISQGKNLGKKNEKTAMEQAEAEAQSRYNKQKKDSYVEDLEQAKKGEDSRDGIKPMLAHKFSDHGHKLVYPVYVQPKIDGHRSVAIINSSEISLWSRKREPIVSMPHIKEQLANLFPLRMMAGIDGDVILDGELFAPGLGLQKIASLARKQSVPEGHDQCNFNIFDIVTPEPWVKRAMHLANLWAAMRDRTGFDNLEIVRSLIADTEDEVMAHFKKFRDEGNEGLMIRSWMGLYIHDRSHDLLKLKHFDEGEFEVVDIIDGVGKMKEHAMAVCITDWKSEFRSTLNMPMNEIAEIYKHRESYIGRVLTVRHEGWTETDKRVPRDPKGVCFRDDI